MAFTAQGSSRIPPGLAAHRTDVPVLTPDGKTRLAQSKSLLGRINLAGSAFSGKQYSCLHVLVSLFTNCTEGSVHITPRLVAIRAVLATSFRPPAETDITESVSDNMGVDLAGCTQARQEHRHLDFMAGLFTNCTEGTPHITTRLVAVWAVGHSLWCAPPLDKAVVAHCVADLSGGCFADSALSREESRDHHVLVGFFADIAETAFFVFSETETAAGRTAKTVSGPQDVALFTDGKIRTPGEDFAGSTDTREERRTLGEIALALAYFAQG